ncbi:MAG: class I SAM-dependent methyltransferase [Planctomycetota bacterium]
MPTELTGDLYDYPKYYDLVFGSDWAPEFHFLKAVFAKHGLKKTQSLFEPACGTGRLMYRLAKDGYDVSGCDLNVKAIDYCNARLKKHGFAESGFVADMCDFRLPKKVDAAFNTISSFRHLETEKQAVAHLTCVADHLKKGGLYVLGLVLVPPDDDWEGEESWSARRGNLSVTTDLRTKDFDRKKRMEVLAMTYDVRTPTEHYVIKGEMAYRTYNDKQMRTLFKKVPSLEVVETYDFAYDPAEPIETDRETEDVIYILKKS